MDDRTRQSLSEGELAGARYELSVPRRLPAGTAGSQLGKAVGTSLEFMDHREYQPGDDLRRIDWSAYARSDRLTVKLYREEVSPHLDVVLDGSRSMALEGTDKARAAAGLAAALACAADNAGYTHAVWLAKDGCRPLGNGASRPAVWDGLDFDAVGGLSEALRVLPPAWRPRGIRVLLSDLLWMGDPLEVLGFFAERASAVFVIQVLAAADVDPPPRGSLRLVDSETKAIQEVFVDAVAERKYRDRLARHQQQWHLASRGAGAGFVPLVAEPLCDGWNLAPLVEAELLKV